MLSFNGFLSLVLLLVMTCVSASALASGRSGKEVYSQTCAMCHGANGKGATPNAPDLTKSGGVLAKSDSVLVHRVLNGYKSMPAMKGNISKAEAKKVVDYMHKAFNVSSKTSG